MSSLSDRFKGLLQRLGSSSEGGLVEHTFDTLKRNDVLQGIPSGYLRDLSRLMHYRDYQRDEFVYHEGDPGLGLYIVQHGSVRLLVRDEKGELQPLRTVRDTETFGEESLAGEFRRQETAQAAQPTRLLGFFRPDLRALAKRNPKAGTAIALALAQHMVRRERRMAALLSQQNGAVAALRTVHHSATEPDTPSPLSLSRQAPHL